MGHLFDNEQANRFEYSIDGELAGFEDYSLDDDTITFLHTETRPAFQGQGVGRELVFAALDEARDRGLMVIPQCTYVASTIAKNPDYLDLVPENRRPDFNL